MDFSNYTLTQMDSLEPETIKNLSKEDYYSYLKRNNELGRSYEMGGKQKRVNVGQPYYSCGSKSLSKNEDGKWEIGVWICGPVFEENPFAVDEETFVKNMFELGVPKEKIDEFINYEINWDNF